MKKLMILGASILQLPAIKEAKKLGLEVVVLDMDPNAIGFNESGIIKEIISTIDTSAVVRCAQKHNINGIMTLASDVPIPTVAAVCKELNLKGISIQTALRATNKSEMRKALSDAKVPIPKYYSVNTLSQFVEAASNFEHSFVVKASDNSGNRGIKLVEVRPDLNTLKEAFEYSKKYSRDGRILLEEYMEGPEFSVEGISVDGKYHPIQITDKITSGIPYFVELGHTQPSEQPLEIQNKIIKVAEDGVKALGIIEGPSHTEIKLTSEGPKIVEIGARLGGGCITSHLVPLSTGVNMVKANIMIALGQSPDLTKKFDKGSAIRFIQPKAGIISEIKGVEETLKKSGVIEIGFFKQIGDKVSEMHNGLDRVSYVIAQGNNRSQAVDLCEDAASHIKIKTM